ncbi:type II secretion system protein GspL [Marinicella rhabdoformis]|uniref:type II secretion system protein GspL n=1 Tax=Marinicella rhabdoformis TaxID=2580566 RepID=UPI0012AEDB46|nr:type II secretion system protein GspL [Marinicella rhabdoformis]
MSQQYILRLNQNGVPYQACIFDQENKRSRESIIKDWADVPKDKEWTVLLPATWVYQTQSSVPSKNTEVLKQSIPYAVEEELSNDVEDNHFAFAILEEGRQKVSVVSLMHLSQLKAAVITHEINVKRLLSEVDFCPKSEGVVSIWIHEDQALLCLGEGETLSVAKEQVVSMLPVFAADLDWVQSNHPIAPEWLSAELEAKPAIQLSDCFYAINNHPVIDLMPAGWLKIEDNNKPLSQAKVLILAAVLIVSWIGIKSFQHIQVNQRLDDIKSQQLALFTSRFGDASKSELVDPYAALQSRMQRVNQAESIETPFLTALNHLGEAIQSHKQNIDIQSLRMVDKKLEVQITAETMTLINRFQQSLQQSALGFKVLIGVNEQNAGRFKSVITMEKL